MKASVLDLHAEALNAAYGADLSPTWKGNILKWLSCLQTDYILTSHPMTPQQLECFE